MHYMHFSLGRKIKVFSSEKTDIGTTSISGKALRASFLAAHQIAKSQKPHTIEKELLCPASIDIDEEMVGKEAAGKIAKITLSDCDRGLSVGKVLGYTSFK